MDHISLSNLNEHIKNTLVKGLSPSYWIVAEISEIRVNPKGHCYLELVEKSEDGIIAKSKATIWAYTYSNLSVWFQRMTGQSIKSGMKILFNATVQYHEVFGLSLNVKDIDANYTIGERAVKRQQIINKLTDDGVIRMNKELSLPLVPQKIAIISSETAAGYGDFIDHIDNNEFGYSIKSTLFQATMQGESASKSVIDALHKIHDNVENFDLVVVIRGGGSQLDLDCFDDYELNAHLTQFPLPIVTGIGHDRDETIADIVAHTSLKTPTAVAEFVVSGVRSFEELIELQLQKIIQSSEILIEDNKGRLNQLNSILTSTTKSTISTHYNQISVLKQRLQFSSKHHLKLEISNLDKMESKLNLLSPETILKRGYTLSSINNKLIKKHPKTGDILVTETYINTIISTVDKIKAK